MKTIYYVTCCLGLAAAVWGGCSSPRNRIAGNYEYKTECMGSEMDGSVTVKAWGNGRNSADALEQAKKNAVYDILFKGIREGKSLCYQAPLLPSGNARMVHETYFNRFFRDGGEFLKYVSLQDERYSDRWNREKKGARSSVTYGIVLRIHRSELKEQLINEGILQL
ncbi:MAG: hypothetical protein LBJ01_08860 [Tannerella sp.]|jgi:hypothetical protein|nr:hypothetical protein [Tannerella sp.]